MRTLKNWEHPKQRIQHNMLQIFLGILSDKCFGIIYNLFSCYWGLPRGYEETSLWFLFNNFMSPATLCNTNCMRINAFDFLIISYFLENVSAWIKMRSFYVPQKNNQPPLPINCPERDCYIACLLSFLKTRANFLFGDPRHIAILDICHFFYTGKICWLKILHPKARILRKIAFRDKIA